jgi:hypothetical protein
VRKDLQTMKVNNWKKSILNRDLWKTTAEWTKTHIELQCLSRRRRYTRLCVVQWLSYYEVNFFFCNLLQYTSLKHKSQSQYIYTVRPKGDCECITVFPGP